MPKASPICVRGAGWDEIFRTGDGWIAVRACDAQTADWLFLSLPGCDLMLPQNLADLELLESTDLPPQTLVAPLSIIREIRVFVGKAKINLVVGIDDAVYVSTDLYEAYNAWDSQRTDFDPLCN